MSTYRTNYTHKVDAISWHNTYQTSGRHVIVDKAKIMELLKDAPAAAATIKNPQIRADFAEIRGELESMRKQLQQTSMTCPELAAPSSPKPSTAAIVKPKRQDTLVMQEKTTPAATPSPSTATAKRPITISSSSSSTSSEDEAKPGASQAVHPTAVKPPMAKPSTPKVKPVEAKRRRKAD